MTQKSKTMNKSLKKLNRAKFKANFNLFIQSLEFIIHCIIMLSIAYLFDRLIQMALFILLFKGIQNCFKIQFHADTLFPDDAIKATKICKVISIIMELFYLVYCKDIVVTIYANLFIIVFIAFVNALLEFSLRNIIVKKLNKKEIILSIVENNEAKIEKFCKKLGVPELAETVYFFLNYTAEEAAEWLGVDSSTVKRRINKFIKISKA